MYLTRKMIVNTIIKIHDFKKRLEDLYSDFDIDINENTGRRNALLSAIQEKCLSGELSLEYEGVENDGSPGKPDIVIHQIGTELECKLTSGSGSKSRSYSLQTDFATITNKKSLDYVYFVTDRDMNQFCVLYFNNLTSSDFFEPPEAARGKARMNKKVAFEKATPLVGNIVNINKNHFENYSQKIKEEEEKSNQRLLRIIEKIDNDIKSSKIETVFSKIKENENSLNKKIDNLKNKQMLWSEKDDSFSINFEAIEDLIKEKK